MKGLLEIWKIGLKRGILGAFILLLLKKRAMHGFELAKEIEKVTQGTLKVKPKTLYPVLHRMMILNFVERVQEKSPIGPPRYIYRLTKNGELLLKEVLLYYAPIVKALIELAKDELSELREDER